MMTDSNQFQAACETIEHITVDAPLNQQIAEKCYQKV